MAKQTEVRLIDDLDGGEAHNTVGFAIDGRGYELDLSKENEEQLRNALAPFIKVARRAHIPAGFERSPRRLRVGNLKETRAGDTVAIRDWARRNNLAVSDRGRVSHDIRRQYQAAMAALHGRGESDQEAQAS